jgi:predicted MFS family arabinose efflux permease
VTSRPSTSSGPAALAIGSGDVRTFYGWRIVAVLAVTETVSWGILYYAFSVFMVPMQRDLGISTAMVSAAFSLALVTMGLSALAVGRWLDRHGGRGLMSWGSVLAVGVVAAWSQVQEAWQLFTVFVGLGVAASMVLYEPAFAIVVRWFDRRRARALLVVTVVAGFASTIFVPTAAALEHALGWRDALLVLAGVLAVTTVLPHALVLRRDPADLGLAPDGDGPPRPAESAPATAGIRATARDMWAEPRFRWLTLAFALHTLAIIGVSVHLFPFLREQGHGAGFAAAVTGALGALSVTGRLVVTGLFARIPTARVTSGVFAIQAAAAVVLLAAPSSATAAVVFVVLFGLGFGVGTIARPALVVEAYGVARYATVSALMGLALAAAKVVGPVSVGASRTASGSYDSALLALVGLTLASALALHAAHRTGEAALSLPAAR